MEATQAGRVPGMLCNLSFLAQTDIFQILYATSGNGRSSQWNICGQEEPKMIKNR